MDRVQRILVLLTALAISAGPWAASSWGQETAPAPTPVSVSPPLPAPYMPGLWHGLPPDPSAYPHAPFEPVGGPPACAPYEDCNGPLLKYDPMLDPAHQPGPGWVAETDLLLTGPHLKNRLTSGITLEATPKAVLVMGTASGSVQLPGADLDWIVSPHVEVGYRFPEGAGAILFGFRELETEGQAVIPDFDIAAGRLRTRLEMEEWDLVYASHEISLDPCLAMQWRVGVRLGHVFFDNRAEGLIAEARTSNSFLGAGPLAALELRRCFDAVPGLGAFARAEGAMLIGRIKQSVEATLALDGVPQAGGAVTNTGSQTSPVLHGQVGLDYQPPWGAGMWRFAFGYYFEQWWLIGRLGDSRADLTTHGILFRAEFNY